MDKTNRLFTGLLLGMALAGAALVLTLPALFGSPEPHQFWITAALGGLTAILGIALILLRPPRRDHQRDGAQLN